MYLLAAGGGAQDGGALPVRADGPQHGQGVAAELDHVAAVVVDDADQRREEVVQAIAAEQRVKPVRQAPSVSTVTGPVSEARSRAVVSSGVDGSRVDTAPVSRLSNVPPPRAAGFPLV